MELPVAIDLIRGGVLQSTAPQTWADLGAGSGLFSNALASLFAPGSLIHAIDLSAEDLKSIRIEAKNVDIIKTEMDFSRTRIDSLFDGLLFANSLHFVADKGEVLNNWGILLKERGRVIVIEYDLQQSNPWIPHPIDYKSLKEIASNLGFRNIHKMHEVPSRYNRANIYSALLER